MRLFDGIRLRAVVSGLLLCLFVMSGVVYGAGYSAEGWAILFDQQEEGLGMGFQDVYKSYISPIEIDMGSAKKAVENGDFSAWGFSVPITVNAGDTQRTDYPVELKMSFGELLSSIGESGTFDLNSVRVVEIDSDGTQLELPSQFDIVDENSGEVIWIMEGVTVANASREYLVYFDIIENGEKPIPEYETGLAFDSDSNHVKNDFLGATFRSNGLLGWLAMWSVTEDKDVFNGDAPWICYLTKDGKDEWWSPENDFAFYEVVSEGPVRVTIMTEISNTLRGVKMQKYYTVYYSSGRVKFKTNWIMEHTLLAAESIRFWITNQNTEYDSKWKYTYLYDGEIVTEAFAKDGDLATDEDWFVASNGQYGLMFALTQNYTEPGFMVSQWKVFGASRSGVPPIPNM